MYSIGEKRVEGSEKENVSSSSVTRKKESGLGKVFEKNLIKSVLQKFKNRWGRIDSLKKGGERTEGRCEVF